MARLDYGWRQEPSNHHNPLNLTCKCTVPSQANQNSYGTQKCNKQHLSAYNRNCKRITAELGCQTRAELREAVWRHHSMVRLQMAAWDFNRIHMETGIQHSRLFKTHRCTLQLWVRMHLGFWWTSSFFSWGSVNMLQKVRNMAAWFQV